MRNIRIADKRLLSVLAILCLAGCDVRRVIGVQWMPEMDQVQTVIDSCIEVTTKRRAFVRTFSDGSNELHFVDTVAGARRVCR